MTTAKKAPAKKPVAKPATKKPATKKPTVKKAAEPVAKPVAPPEPQNRVLYTIRLEPSIIAKLNDMAKKLGTTHAAVARGILAEGV